MHFPEFDKSPTLTLMIDDNQKKVVKELEQILKVFFNPKRIRFIVLTDSLQTDFLQSNTMFFIEKADFNKVGIMKKEKESVMKSFSDDVFINFSDNNENLQNDYLVSCIDATFKIGHSKVNMELHDLVLDYGIETNDVERLKILYRYLMMLSGNKNEK